jgi:LAGLIDADG-like domain
MQKKIVARAWAAGLFDGEGCVAVYQTTAGTFALHIEISMKRRVCLERFQRMYGGSVSVYKNKWGDFYRWGLYGENALKFLRSIQPFSVEKEKQITIGIEFQLRRQPSGIKKRRLTDQEWNQDYADYLQMHELKKEIQ